MAADGGPDQARALNSRGIERSQDSRLALGVTGNMTVLDPHVHPPPPPLTLLRAPSPARARACVRVFINWPFTSDHQIAEIHFFVLEQLLVSWTQESKRASLQSRSCNVANLSCALGVTSIMTAPASLFVQSHGGN